MLIAFLKKRIHLPYLLWRQRRKGRRYARAPKLRAEELFRADYGRELRWDAPVEFAEMIRCIQFHTDISRWPLLADKLRARTVVAEKGLGDMLIPLLGSWTSAEEIDFDSLPSSYVIKPNNGCGDIHIVSPERPASRASIRRSLARALRRTYGGYKAETHYADIAPAILAEQLLTDPAHPTGIPDYKFYCVDGRPLMCLVCTDRDYAGPDTKRVAIYDIQWQLHPEWLRPEAARHMAEVPRPKSLQQMIDACHTLAADLPFVRLDLYEARGHPYFGEFTLTPAALGRHVTLSDAALRLIADNIAIPAPPADAPYLTVAISTLGAAGMERVTHMQLPQLSEVEYVVSWQRSDGIDIPAPLACRPDIRVIRTDTVGLSNNRNASFAAARGEVILIADDDLTYTPAQLQAVIDTFRTNPAIDFATFRYDKPRYKVYPTEVTPYSRIPAGFHPVSFEIAFRSYMVSGPRALSFNPLLGIGAPYLTCGEEDLFISQALRRGYRGAFFPITITTHLGAPTGARAVTDPGVLRAQGALIAHRRPLLWPVAVAVNSLRTGRRGRAPFLRALRLMAQGAVYFLRRRKLFD